MFKVQSNKFKVQSNKSSENISQRIFYLLIGLAVLVFGLFFLVGYDMPFVENPDFNASLFTDVLIVLMWLFLIGGVGLAVYSTPGFHDFSFLSAFCFYLIEPKIFINYQSITSSF